MLSDLVHDVAGLELARLRLGLVRLRLGLARLRLGLAQNKVRVGCI